MNALHFRTSRIDVDNPHDVLRWAEQLDVQAGELRDAVMQVGDDAEAVELVLKGALSVCARH